MNGKSMVVPFHDVLMLILLKAKVAILTEIYAERAGADVTKALFQVMIEHRIGTKPFTETLVTRFTTASPVPIEACVYTLRRDHTELT